MAHGYRGAVPRVTGWYERLDRTTNWAVTVMADLLAWAFSDPSNPHFPILVGAVAVSVFPGLEAHRFRASTVWRTAWGSPGERLGVRAGPSDDLVHEDWRAELAEDYREPEPKIGYEEALAHRLRRISPRF